MTGICVIGRAEFQTGIGTVSAAAIELLSRRYNVSLHAPRSTHLQDGDRVTLPTGRSVPIVTDPSDFAVYFFADVLWNGYSDFNYASVPADGLRIAHMAYDSSELPTEWVQILNDHFDIALFSSEYLVQVAKDGGVTIDVGTLPIGLDLEPLLSRSYREPLPTITRFGTVSAYHSRKNLDILVDAFVRRYAGDPTSELFIHSNLAFGDTYARVESIVSKAGATNVHLSVGDLSVADKDALIDTFDVYVNVSAGEGYSIGPREALALGKPLVLSAIPAHDDLMGLPGVFAIEPSGYQPARYPEIENRVMGRQALIRSEQVGDALALAKNFVTTALPAQTAAVRRRRAAEFSYTTLASAYAELVNPDAALAKPNYPRSSFVKLPDPLPAIVQSSAGRHGSKLGGRKLVVPLHDGGFFSIFNTYLSHLVWGLQDEDVALVLPDWRASDLVERSAAEGNPITSFCYGRPEDGNSWLGLFEPVFGLSPDEMNDREFLYAGAEKPKFHFNEQREPKLTYITAHDLYLSPTFGRMRKQYNAVLNEHVRLIEPYRKEIDGFVDQNISGKYTVAVHVKHPSHSIEQASGKMADRFQYVRHVRAELDRRGVDVSSDDWSVFLATDQDRVRDVFVEEFGDHLIAFDDVTRTAVDTDERFDSLSDEEKSQDGHQLQHQMAADTDRWSSRLAWEVWRDAEALAASDVVIHSISNVATAVGFMNAENRMQYYEAD